MVTSQIGFGVDSRPVAILCRLDHWHVRTWKARRSGRRRLRGHSRSVVPTALIFDDRGPLRCRVQGDAHRYTRLEAEARLKSIVSRHIILF